MPVSKRPRKPRVPKPELLPLGIKRAGKETTVLLALEALGKPCFGPAHLGEFLAHAEIIQEVAHNDEVRAVAVRILRACETIMARWSRLDKLGATGDEIRELRECLGATVPYLREVPNTVYYRAITKIVKERR